MSSKKILVAYFSASGVTAKVAGCLAEAVHADIHEIQPKVPYTIADQDWRNPDSRSSRERNQSARPAIGNQVDDMGQYDVVFLGFPIWWYLAPTIINTFLESYDFAGKTIVPFATSGGSGMGDTDKVLHSLCPDTVQWKAGKLLSIRMTKDELARWAESLEL